MRRPSPALMSICLGLFLAACAAPLAPATDSTDGDQSTPAPAEEPTENPGEGGGGNVGEGGAPALADGPWTSGHAQITVSGAVEMTIDQDLTQDADISMTQEAKTQLAYNTEREFVTININLIGVPFASSVSGDDWSALASEDCEASYDRADDTGIDGTFTCVVDEFYWYSADPEPSGDITIEGSFTASR